MTDGTSQGLFVVVAIVIFGIFVALSYTVFGNDGLSGGINNIFVESTSKTTQVLKRNLINSDNLEINPDYHTPIEYNNGVFTFTEIRPLEESNGLISIRINPDIEEDAVYTLSGYLKINDEPVTEEQWVIKYANNFSVEEPISFHVNSSNGYFEITYVAKTVPGRGYRRLLHTVFHNEHGELLHAGDSVSIKNFFFYKH